MIAHMYLCFLLLNLRTKLTSEGGKKEREKNAAENNEK